VCFKGYEEMARILIEAGADVNARNGMGGTCLIFAVTFNREGIAKLLIDRGADTNAVDSQGQTALYHARTQGLQNMVSLLEKNS
jgi:ankyrin repeat protein